MEKLMNEENEWEHSISTTIKEGPADCIRIDEVVAALKKMKNTKPQVYSPCNSPCVASRGSDLHEA